MRIVQKKHLGESEKLSSELKWMLNEGRRKRDLETFNVETEKLKLKPLWDNAFFVGRCEELSKLQSLIAEKDTEKFVIQSQWARKVNQLSSDLEKLNSLYVPETLEELTLAVRRIERFFDFSFFPEDKIYSGARDSFSYKFQTNLSLVNASESLLLKAKSEILLIKGTASLSKILEIFDETMTKIPSDFPLDETISGGPELLSDFRARRELASEPLLFEQHDRYFSVANPNPLGETLGKLAPLLDHFKIKPKGGK